MRTYGRSISDDDLIQIEADSQFIAVDSLLDPELRAEAATSGIFIAPGFIDLQVNGFAGVDYNSPTASHEEIERSIWTLFSTGVTRFFPTVITGSPDDMLRALRNLAVARARTGVFSAMEGFHVEGPHISAEDGPRGAHPRQWARSPDLNEFRRWQDATDGHIRLVTLAPEWPESTSYIEQLVSEGVVASIGHTRASSQQIKDAVSAGATLSTHLGNGADAVLPRHPNYIWDQLAEDRLAASFIVDGVHLSDAFLRVALRAKTTERSILVTDAVMPAMCEPGNYMLGEVEVELKNDVNGSQRVVLRGGTRLAGSSLRMDDAISNLLQTRNVSFQQAIAMATSNPARIGKIGDRQRGINPGQRADLVRFRMEEGRMKIVDTYLSGELVYSANA